MLRGRNGNLLVLNRWAVNGQRFCVNVGEMISEMSAVMILNSSIRM